MSRVAESAYVTAAMLAGFTLMMTFGFWLRFGVMPWEAM